MNLLKTSTRITGLILCVCVFAGTALAGDKPEDGAPGNSGSAPGQVKKQETPPAPPAAAPAPAPAAAPAPPAEKQEAKAEKQEAKAEKKAEKQAAKQETKAAKPAQAAKPAAPAASPKAAKQEAKAEKKVEKQAEKQETKVAKQEAKPNGTGSYKATSSGTDLKNGLDHKHTICHATGSSKNPYVVITPSVSGVYNGHIGHQGGEDIIPPFVYKGQTYSQNWDATGQALFANGCRPAASTTTTTTTTATTPTTTTTTTSGCPTTTVTVMELKRGGVMHKTGNGYVFIQPSLNSAHYDKSKHADDIIVPDTLVPVQREVAGNCDTTTTSSTTTTTIAGQTTTVTLPNETVTLAGTTTTLAGSTVTIPGQTVTVGGTVTTTAQGEQEQAGGVLGAQSPPGAGGSPGADEEAGGVLDAVASVGETAVTGTLPFTGVPLWIAVLLGGGLLAAGIAMRRTT